MQMGQKLEIWSLRIFSFTDFCQNLLFLKGNHSIAIYAMHALSEGHSQCLCNVEDFHRTE